MHGCGRVLLACADCLDVSGTWVVVHLGPSKRSMGARLKDSHSACKAKKVETV
jgi:hypothetical protein